MPIPKALLGLAVVLLGYWMFTDPQGLADAARNGVDRTVMLARQLFTALTDFVGALV